MGDAIQKPFLRMAISIVFFIKIFLPGRRFCTNRELYSTFVASRSITFEKGLFSMECQSLVDESTCFCMGIVILFYGSVQ